MDRPERLWRRAGDGRFHDRAATRRRTSGAALALADGAGAWRGPVDADPDLLAGVRAGFRRRPDFYRSGALSQAAAVNAAGGGADSGAAPDAGLCGAFCRCLYGGRSGDTNAYRRIYRLAAPHQPV